MTNLQTVEAWLNDSDSRGHNSNNSLFFEGATLYSYGYHYPLAYRTGHKAVTVNNVKWSVTTSRHQSLTRYRASLRGWTVEEANLCKD
jgi:hypothetical protein